MFEEPRPHVISSMAYLVSRVLVSLVLLDDMIGCIHLRNTFEINAKC